MSPGSRDRGERHASTVLGLTRTEGLQQASVRRAGLCSHADGMSTDELSRGTSWTNDHLAAARISRTRGMHSEPFDKLRTAPAAGRASTGSALKGLVPLALLAMIFIGYAVPPYLALDPAQARIQSMPPYASYYLRCRRPGDFHRRRRRSGGARSGHWTNQLGELGRTS
jgi:hypothetical protein